MKIETKQFFVRSPDQMYDGVARATRRRWPTSARIADRVDIEPRASASATSRSFPPPGETDAQATSASSAERDCERYGDDPPRPSTTGSSTSWDHRPDGLRLLLPDRLGLRPLRPRERHPRSARGSACGAMVCYLLGLSDVDPIKYDLLFERFLDPNRTETPDIDIDFCQDRRDVVIDYVQQKYGAETSPRSARSARWRRRPRCGRRPRARRPAGAGRRARQADPAQLDITLDEALEECPSSSGWRATTPRSARLLDIGERLEGPGRNAGTHAAGVVIADQPLIEYRPAAEAPDKDRTRVVLTQWDSRRREGRPAEDGLPRPAEPDDPRARRPADRADTAASRSTSTRLPLDDQATFALLQRGETKGIFQFESAACATC